MRQLAAMSDTAGDEITSLLLGWRGGDDQALEQLMPLVYQELRSMAHRQMRKEGAVTLQPTALVHEAYLRMVNMEVQWQDRAHFFALSATMMRRILIDEAKRRRAGKRGGGEALLALEDIDQATEPETELLALSTALDALAELDERKAKVVELRFFAGLTIPECSEVLGVGHATVERDLKMARVWLADQMRRGNGSESSSKP